MNKHTIPTHQRVRMREDLVGKRIREYRLNKGLTIKNLAESTGLTKGYISRIENSPKAPPLFTLAKISSALSVDISELLSDGKTAPNPSPEMTISRNDEHFITDGRGTPYKYVYEALAPNKLGKNFEPYLLTVSHERRTDYQHEGEEFVYVLEGKLEFVFKGQSYVLEKGDCVYFDSAFPHGGRALGDAPAKIMVIIYSYKRV
jgi:transcriptional regulator with XRE-family HTH domain